LRSKTLPSRTPSDAHLGMTPMKSKRESKTDKGRASIEVDALRDEVKHGAFSDEYDLCKFFNGAPGCKLKLSTRVQSSRG
jgi:hypothetical protein